MPPLAPDTIVPGLGLTPTNIGTTLAQTDSQLPQAGVTSALRPKVPGYEILGELGRGGMGVVYKARQLGLNRTVALKMILSGGHAGAADLTRFRSEAEAVARLQHPNIVQIHEVGEHDGLPYFSLEYVGGGTLASKLNGTPWAAPRAARLAETLARAMDVAHRAGIVHRDLKPANVLLTDDGTPKVTDFGIAKQLDSLQGLTQSGAILGTPSYMAPEQASGQGDRVGPAADVWALGVVLYEMLTGRTPFRAATPLDTMLQVVHAEPVSPVRLAAGVPRDLETICLKCLQKEPAKRYASAAELADDLRCYLDNRPISARPAGAVERAVKWARRRPALAALAATVVLAAGVIAAGGLWAYAAVTREAADAHKAEAAAAAAAELGRQRQVRLCVADGTRLLDAGDPCGAALWFAEALRLDEGRPDREQMHRKRLGAVLALCPSLDQVWAHDGPVLCAAFTPDGRRVVTSAGDGTARVWDAATGGPLTGPLAHGGPVALGRLSPDGRRLLTAGPAGDCRVWDADAGRLLRAIPAGAAPAAAAFHPSGRALALATEAGLRVWDADSGVPASPPLAHEGVVTELTFNADGSLLLSAGPDGTARLWDAATYAPAAPPMAHGAPIQSAEFSPDGTRVVTGGTDGVARVWDARTGKPLPGQPVRTRGPLNQASFGPDGHRLVTAGDNRAAQVWDAASGEDVGPQMRHGSKVLAAAFSADGRWVVTASDDLSARVWDAATAAPASPLLRHNGSPTDIAFGAGGRSVLTASRDGLARLWRLPESPAPAPPATHVPESAAAREASSRDGRLVVTFNAGSVAQVLRADDRRPLTPALRHGAPVTVAAFNPAGDVVVTGACDGSVQAWDVRDGTPRWSAAPRHASKALAVAFSPDGTRVATGGDDNTVLVRDAASGRPVAPAVRCDGSVIHVAFSDAGDVLFAACVDGTSRVWDAATGEPLTPQLPAWDGRPWHDDLPADGRPTAELVTLAEVLSGARIAEDGGLTRLTPSELREQWARLPKRQH
jgi:WD40 repeat protein